MVEAFSHRPLWQHYTEDALANDKRGAGEILAALPPGGLLGSLIWDFSAFCGPCFYRDRQVLCDAAAGKDGLSDRAGAEQ